MVMKRKVSIRIEFERCWDCPYLRWEECKCTEVDGKYRIINDLESIPDWCPLLKDRGTINEKI